jgi:GMP synthase-like glutamine amidotransferase
MAGSAKQSKSSPSGKVTIVFLKCDKVPEEAIEAHGEYQDILHNLFEPIMPQDRKLELETLSYDVLHKREYPKEDVLERADAVIVSGSFEDEAHADTMWILKLAGFLIKLHVSRDYAEGGEEVLNSVQDEYPKTRIIGICFGLQVIARAFGPSTIKENPKGW